MAYNLSGKVQALTLWDVGAAIEAAYAKHGPLTTDPVRACAILLREGGEAMDEALMATTDNIPDGTPMGRDETIDQLRVRWHVSCRRRLYDELAQVAATAMIIMDNLKKEEAERGAT